MLSRRLQYYNFVTVLVPGQSRSEASFRRVQALERGVPGDQLPTLLVAERGEVSTRLRIRRAVLVFFIYKPSVDIRNFIIVLHHKFRSVSGSRYRQSNS